MTYKFLTLPLAFTLFFCPPALANVIYYDNNGVVTTNARPKVVGKVRVKVARCYEQPQRDFTSVIVCDPDKFYLRLSNGETIQVTEGQYNRNVIQKPLVR